MARYTQNYQLHQWEAGDDFLRTDFNEDFAKIDGALMKNAKISVGSYQGTGTSGADSIRTLTVDFKPRFLWVRNASFGSSYELIAFEGQTEVKIYAGNATSTTHVSWGDNNVSWYTEADAFFAQNWSGETYHYLILG